MTRISKSVELAADDVDRAVDRFEWISKIAAVCLVSGAALALVAVVLLAVIAHRVKR